MELKDKKNPKLGASLGRFRENTCKFEEKKYKFKTNINFKIFH